MSLMVGGKSIVYCPALIPHHVGPGDVMEDSIEKDPGDEDELENIMDEIQLNMNNPAACSQTGKGEGKCNKEAKNIHEKCAGDKMEMAEVLRRISSYMGKVNYQLASKEGSSPIGIFTVHCPKQQTGF